MINGMKARYSTVLSMINKISVIYTGRILGNAVNAHWYVGDTNFGDLLNPVLLKYYGLTPINITKKSAKIQVLAIGSILDSQPEDYSGFIIGSGLMSDTRKVFPNANILAVRGALTRDRINAPIMTILGDPGLLVSKIYKKKHEIKYELGLIPHYMDKQDQRFASIRGRYPQDVLIIDVQRKPKEVIDDIKKCSHILSSSLHGIVTADSLGVSNAWIYLSDSVIGKGFKFQDYASAIGRNIEPKFIIGNENLSQLLNMTSKVEADIDQIQEKLDKAFRQLSTEILCH